MSWRIVQSRRVLFLTSVAAGMVAPAACEPTGPPETTATFVGRWANQEWNGDAWATSSENTLAIGGTHPLNAGQLPLHTVSVVTAANAPGTYQLGAGDAGFSYLIGGDVLTARYDIPEGGSGTLTIETITDSSVTGRLMFSAVAVYSHGEPPVGERAIFEGTFNARIQRFSISGSIQGTPSSTVH